MRNELYKGFKKVSEDDKSVTMAHPNGHKLQIAKNGLSSKLRRQLSSLPLNQAEGSEEVLEDPQDQAAPAPAFIPRGSQGIDMPQVFGTRQDVSPQDLTKYGSVDDAMEAAKYYKENPTAPRAMAEAPAAPSEEAPTLAPKWPGPNS